MFLTFNDIHLTSIITKDAFNLWTLVRQLQRKFVKHWKKPLKTIAIPISGGHISNRIDCCEKILLATIINNSITEKQIIRLTENKVNSFTNLIKKLNVDVLICNGLPEAYGHLLESKTLTIIQWKYGKIDAVLKWYLNEKDRLLHKNN